MNNGKKFWNKRMCELKFNNNKHYINSKKIVYKKHGKPHIHSFNYLSQKKYLELDEICNNFNSIFQGTLSTRINEDQKKRLTKYGFSTYIEQEKLHFFDNNTLETAFFPSIQGYYIKHDNHNCYMLLSIKSHDKVSSGLKLIKYIEPYFSFPHQDNYI